MRIKKMYFGVGIFIIACMIFIAGCTKDKKSNDKKTAIGDIAYDGYVSSGFLRKIGFGKNEVDERNYTVYIKENDKFEPYLVLTSDYNGNTLLLRKFLLEKEYAFEIEGVDIYYENSSIDKFLNNEYIKTLDSYIQDSIVNTSILITKGYTSEKGFEMDVYPIERKVFLISCAEIGLEGWARVGKEGETLEYFKDKKRYLAYAREGEKERVWYLRTPYFGNSYRGIWVVGMGGSLLGTGIADFGQPDGKAKYSVRPAFCVSNSLSIEESTEVIEGETVYVLKNKR
ncbi:MAG TPA: DUF6273 domain-containing protein [Acetivibrio clariflavus]|nr:DUF6273 domain-containing protein [Acetivibrio clariflavus]